MAYYEDMLDKTSVPTLRASIPLKLLPESLRNSNPQNIGEQLRFIAMERSANEQPTQVLLAQPDRFRVFMAGDRVVIDFGAIPESSRWSLKNTTLSDPNKPTAPQKVRDLIAKHLLPEGSTAHKQIYVTYGLHNPDGP